MEDRTATDSRQIVCLLDSFKAFIVFDDELLNSQ
jgi:hypothetical protein